MKKWNPEPGRISFNPRTPCGGRLIGKRCHPQTDSFNPRTPCGVRPRQPYTWMCRLAFQSTHSLRSATVVFRKNSVPLSVSIHALLAECDRYSGCSTQEKNQFQSTHSLRSATPLRGGGHPGRKFQSTHSLRSATWWARPSWPSTSFQSTHSLRSATKALLEQGKKEEVSIHALLAECDISKIKGFLEMTGRFNPRTPCGVRPARTGQVSEF